MNGRVSPGRLIGWWAAALARTLAPRRAQATPWRALLLKRAEKLEVHLRDGRGASRVLGTISTGTSTGGTDEAAIASALKTARLPRESVVLRLAPDEVIRTGVELPVGVRDVLDQVVRNQLERLTPFAPEKALFAYRIAAEPPGPGQIGVELWVTGRERVENLMARLADLSIVPGRVDFGTASEAVADVNLLARDGEERHRREQRSARFISLLLSALLLANLAAGAWFGYVTYQRQILREEVAAKLAAASALADPRAEERRRQRQALIDQRRAAQASVVTIEALSRALPDNAFLDRLELRDGVITITGKAANVPALIAPLEGIGAFEQVQFAAATTRQDGETLDSFSISARLRPGANLEPRRAP